MKAIKAFFFLIVIVGNSQALEQKKLPNVNKLINYDAKYSIVLFDYFNGDFQKSLKELTLIDTSDLTSRQLRHHKAFKQILQLSNGKTSLAPFISVAKNEAAIQSLLLAINEQIDSHRWQKARKLFKLLPRKIPLSLKSQHAFLSAQLALQTNATKGYSKAKKNVEGSSLEYALLLQNQSVKDKTPSISLLNQLIALKTESFSDIKNDGLLTLGYRFLDKNDAPSAVKAFKNISLNSLSENAAALGLGLSFNQLMQFQNARVLLQRVTDSHDPSVVFYEAQLADSFALEQLGNEQLALKKLTTLISQAQQRNQQLPMIENHLIAQNQCIINLLNNALLNECDLKGEELNEQFLALLSTQPFIDINKQTQDIVELELQYNQQMETLMSFNYLLNHQVTLINELLNDKTMSELAETAVDITEKKDVVVSDVDDAEEARNGHFFLSEHYLALQERIDNVFKRMVFLKRAGQKNVASERRVSLMQRILWWQSYSNFTKHINQTRDGIDKLNQQLADNSDAYRILEGYLAKVPLMTKQLETVAALTTKIENEQAKLNTLKTAINDDIKLLFKNFVIQQQVALKKVIINAELAIVRIQDASFNRALANDEVEKQ